LKKFLAIILGALFVLSFAASAFAIHAEIPSETQAVIAAGGTQITLGGDIRSRGWYTHNIDYTNMNGLGDRMPAPTNSSSWYDERVRLSLDAKVEPGIEGFVMLESDGVQGNTNGAASSDDVYVWGNFDNKPTTMGILQAWIVYSGSGLFGFPTGLKIGHMPLALGQKEFFDHTKFGDDAIVFFALPTKEIEFDLLKVEFGGEGNAYNIPNVLGSGTTLSVPAAGIPGVLTNSKFINSGELAGYVGILTAKLDDKNTVGVNYTYLNLSQLQFSNQDLGFTANGNIAGFGYKGALDVQFGQDNTAAADQKFRGYALELGANFNLNPVNFRAMYAYGSGDNNSTDNKNKNFVTYLDYVQHYTLVYEYQVVSTAGTYATGLTNTNYFNVGIDVTPIKDLTASLDAYIIRASATMPGVSKSAGWEVDGKVVYSLAKNLTYQIDAGYFKSGDFYQDTIGEKAGATVLRNLIELSF